MTSGRRVLVNTGDRHVAVLEQNVYFAFASGRLAYDCVSCNAQCCRGHGYALGSERELLAQLKLRPGLVWFLDRSDSETAERYEVSNCKPSCFFLTENGLCRIQLENGYEAKPETCRLFPFNNLVLAGDYLIVAPHLGLCPLTFVRPPSTSGLSQYSTLMQVMSSEGIGARVPRVAVDSSRPLSEVIHSEREIVQMAETYSAVEGYAQFAAAQLALARSGLRSTSETTEHSCERELETFYSALTLALGIRLPVPTADRRVSELVVALTPFVRSQLLFTGKHGTDLAPDQLPRFLIALHLLALVLKETGTHVTYQSIVQLLSTYGPLLWMLAHADAQMCWRRSQTIDAPLRRSAEYEQVYLSIVKALQPANQHRSGALLGQVLCDSIPDAGVGRMVYLKALARQLRSKIVRRDRMQAATRRTFRAAFQQCVHSHVDSHALAAALRWRRERAARATGGSA